ncbi:hypothetical protein [Clostridium perfringens]|jgi:hypothetical protein|nr:hypothetical protein [Clostridium perfringens]EHR1329327.1 hypothetical protein [Clostridium perfringens]EHR1332457.1 hypothetical protein [Clostridium perfringens]EHR1426037.1 hypothetical protein [Clostridium perfringens]EIF6155365.1 hypothetical protein [Clostridium perfringens]ELC8411517.1 hypothetical protein [Clostridium perfringens]
MNEEQEIQNFVKNAIYLKKNNYLEYIKIKSFLEGMEMERKNKEREKKC